MALKGQKFKKYCLEEKEKNLHKKRKITFSLFNTMFFY